MKEIKHNARRQILKGALGASAVAALPGQWKTPIVNSVFTPAHGQTSPVCPDVVIGNVVFGPVSGTPTPPVCQTTFDVLSSDAATPLTIIGITDDNSDPDTTITYDTFGEATDTTGPRVVWQGPASDAPFCSDATPTTDVTFTITATCDAIGDDTFTQSFALTEILE